MRSLTKCLISPSGEYSNGICSGVTIFAAASYRRRCSAEFSMASARKLQAAPPMWAKSRSSGELIIACPVVDDLQIGRWGKIFVADRRRGGRKRHYLLKQQVHEQEERPGLEDQEMRVIVGIIVEMLMHAAVLDEHDVAGLPVDAPLVMDIVAAPFQNVEYRAVHMAMFLAIGSGRVNFD